MIVIHATEQMKILESNMASIVPNYTIEQHRELLSALYDNGWYLLNGVINQEGSMEMLDMSLHNQWFKTIPKEFLYSMSPLIGDITLTFSEMILHHNLTMNMMIKRYTNGVMILDDGNR